jgi:hypothetical protein
LNSVNVQTDKNAYVKEIKDEIIHSIQKFMLAEIDAIEQPINEKFQNGVKEYFKTN